jgi:hypothetical protein
VLVVAVNSDLASSDKDHILQQAAIFKSVPWSNHQQNGPIRLTYPYLFRAMGIKHIVVFLSKVDLVAEASSLPTVLQAKKEEVLGLLFDSKTFNDRNRYRHPPAALCRV